MAHFQFVSLWSFMIIVCMITEQQTMHVVINSLSRSHTTLKQLQSYEMSLLQIIDNKVIFLTGLSTFNIAASSNSTQFKTNLAISKNYYDPSDIILEHLLQFIGVYEHGNVTNEDVETFLKNTIYSFTKLDNTKAFNLVVSKLKSNHFKKGIIQEQFIDHIYNLHSKMKIAKMRIPSNLLLTNAMEPFIIEFGICCAEVIVDNDYALLNTNFYKEIWSMKEICQKHIDVNTNNAIIQLMKQNVGMDAKSIVIVTFSNVTILSEELKQLNTALRIIQWVYSNWNSPSIETLVLIL
eukprot:47324_1